MKLEIYKEIEKIADKIKLVEGVIGVVLFGSYSREDFDEGSDIDFLIIFKDKNLMTKNQKEIYKTTSQTNLFIQAIILTLEELKNSTLLDSVRREGKIFYANEEIYKLLIDCHKPYALITYATKNLTPKRRVILSQKLEGRRNRRYMYDGILKSIGGYKIGRGVIMIPVEKQSEITEYLEKMNVDYFIRYVWM